jgi:hypothetical protein
VNGEWERIWNELNLALDEGELSASRPGRTVPRDNPRYLLDRRQGGPKSWSGHRGKRMNPLPLIVTILKVTAWLLDAIEYVPRRCR